MRRNSLISLFLCLLLLTLAGCGYNRSVRQLPHLGNTPYQQDTILVAYATNPERALTLLDSALLLGNVSEYRAQFIRAKIYSKSLAEQRLDSAIAICKDLLKHDSVLSQPAEQMNILDMLIACSRARPDYEQYLQWATQKAELCQKQGEETERWRTEADIGLIMTQLGQVDNGIKKLDEAISHLDSPGSIDRMDAFVVACKRRINTLDALQRFDEVIPLGQRILDRLDHYEQHSNDYAEDSYRLSWSDNPVDRDRYLDFSRAQAWGFMAHAHAMRASHFSGNQTSPPSEGLGEARYYLTLFEGTNYSKSFSARRFIAPTQIALGNYDEALATYAEMERRMAADTINDEYAVILRARAIASRAKGHTAQALDYQTRYANLSIQLSDSLHRSEAHNYAARYHAQEQQLEIQEKQAEAQRFYIMNIAVAVIAILAIAFAVYFFRQKRIISAKNRALVRMINNNASPKEVPKENSDEFANIDHTIRTEHLYKVFNLQRQDICDRFGINRHTLNDMLTQHADGLSFPQYINAIRLEESLHLLHNEPGLTISAIAKAVGFSPSNFREQFKQKYGMTPQEYRQNM